MEAISVDLRRRIAAALDEGTEAITAIARRFKVSRRWIYNFIELREQTGDIVRRPHGGGRKRKVTGRQLGKIKERIAERPDATLDELRRYSRTRASITAVFRVLQKEGISRKKKV